MEVKPFLKWVGGKRKLIPQLEAIFPDYIKSSEFTYVEPFLGGGAMFFHLITKYKIKKAYLNDLNDKLINCYLDIKYRSIKVIELLKVIEKDYFSIDDKESFYYDKRQEFNSIKISEKKSALLIFLNKTGFNGMYRENSKGEYNIPFGKMKVNIICNEKLIKIISNIIREVEFSSKSFEDVLIDKKNVFYYLDPPYMPISKTSSFTDYTSKSKNKDQVLLQDKICEYCNKIDELGSMFLQSNSYLPKFFEEKYESRFFFDKLKVSRTIGADGSKRKSVYELLIFNYKKNNNFNQSKINF